MPLSKRMAAGHPGAIDINQRHQLLFFYGYGIEQAW